MVTLWVEEYLLEHNLVLDILFLVYYNNVCICSSQQWKKLCVIFVVCFVQKPSYIFGNFYHIGN